MTDKLTEYKQAQAPLPERYQLWPLYGAGFDSMGLEGKPIEVDSQSCGPDELIVRHDAVGLCFSDIKIINLGQNHPRIHYDMQKKPVVLGHEVAMTVVAVGENMRDRYKPVIASPSKPISTLMVSVWPTATLFRAACLNTRSSIAW
jgi:L-sorbose 1-phosphate reductase